MYAQCLALVAAGLFAGAQRATEAAAGPAQLADVLSGLLLSAVDRPSCNVCHKHQQHTVVGAAVTAAAAAADAAMMNPQQALLPAASCLPVSMPCALLQLPAEACLMPFSSSVCMDNRTLQQPCS